MLLVNTTGKSDILYLIFRIDASMLRYFHKRTLHTLMFLLAGSTSIGWGQSLGVTPTLFEKQVIPGDQLSFDISLINHGIENMNLTVSVLSFNSDPYTGTLDFVDDFQAVHSCQSWITVNPRSMIIQPGEKRDVTVFIDIPEGIEGGYYSAIFFNSKGDEVSVYRNSFAVSTRTGTTVSLTSQKGKKIDADILFFDAENDEESTMFRMGIINLGNVHISPGLSIVIFSDEGRVVDRITKKGETFLLPQGRREYTVNWSNKRKRVSGKQYRAECRFEVAGLGRALRESAFFTASRE